MGDKCRLLELLREWARGFEERYGVETGRFHEAWERGETPEPDDPERHADYTIWSGIAETIRELTRQCRHATEHVIPGAGIKRCMRTARLKRIKRLIVQEEAEVAAE